MCKTPVTLGGGMTMTKGFFSPLRTFSGSALKGALAQRSAHLGSTFLGS